MIKQISRDRRHIVFNPLTEKTVSVLSIDLERSKVCLYKSLIDQSLTLIDIIGNNLFFFDTKISVLINQDLTTV